MRLVLLLLVCSVTATFQQYQESSWFSPYYSWIAPYFYNGHFVESEPVLPPPSRYYSPYVSKPKDRVRQQDLELLKLLLDSNNKQGPWIDSSLEGRIKMKNDMKLEDRGFGGLKFLGFNALANYAINSLTGISSTSTTTSFVTSSLTIGTVVSCYTRTLFLSTTPCRRRKRKLLPGLLVGDDNSDYPISPSQPESIEASLELEAEKQRQAKMNDGIDRSKIVLESSIKEQAGEDAAAPQGTVSINSSEAHRQKRFFGFKDSNEIFDALDETVFVSTATLTTFSMYTSTLTSTIVRLAATTALSCLPACFTLC